MQRRPAVRGLLRMLDGERWRPYCIHQRMTKVLTVRVPPVLLGQADAKAARLGLDRTQYVRQLIERDLTDNEARAGGFKSEDLAGRFRLGGTSATNARVRQQWRQRQQPRREANR